MKKIKESVIRKIRQENIKPKAKWRFEAGEVFKKIIFTFFFLLGLVAIAVFWYLIFNVDWMILGRMRGIGVINFLRVVPLVWLFLVIIFFYLAFKFFYATRKGYRAGIFLLVGVVLVSAILTSLAFSQFTVSQRLHRKLTRQVPQYSKLVYTKEKQWSQPVQGLLGGDIVGVEGNVFRLRDFESKIWQIKIDANTRLRGPIEIKEGKRIKLIGRMQSEEVFMAEEIRPWEGKGMGSSGGWRQGRFE